MRSSLWSQHRAVTEEPWTDRLFEALNFYRDPSRRHWKVRQVLGQSTVLALGVSEEIERALESVLGGRLIVGDPECTPEIVILGQNGDFHADLRKLRRAAGRAASRIRAYSESGFALLVTEGVCAFEDEAARAAVRDAQLPCHDGLSAFKEVAAEKGGETGFRWPGGAGPSPSGPADDGGPPPAGAAAGPDPWARYKGMLQRGEITPAELKLRNYRAWQALVGDWAA